MVWSTSNNRCRSCETTYYKHKAKGLCLKCYRAYREIDRLNRAGEEDLEEYMYKFVSVRDIPELKLKNILEKKQIIKKYIESKRLRYLKLYGLIQNKKRNVDVLTLEHIMNDVARRITKKSNFYTQDLSYFVTRFKEPQRRIFALKILKMLIECRQ